MKKSRRIKTIVELKQKQEKKALEEFGGCQQKTQEVAKQLQDLIAYRQDYQNKYMQLGGGGVGVRQLLDFRAFMSKLDQAIADQQQSLQVMEKELQTKRKIWENAYQRTKSLQKVQNTAQAVELQEEDKREQNEQDDRASRTVK